MNPNLQPLISTLSSWVSSERLKRDVEFFGTRRRDSGEQGEREAAEYIVESLRSEGVDCHIETFDSLLSLPRAASLNVVGHDEVQLRVITHSFSGVTGENGVRADLVYRGNGDLEDYADTHLKGKAVLMRGLASPDMMKYVRDAGGAALLCFVEEEHLHEITLTPIWGTPTTETAGEIPDLPGLSMPLSAGQKLIGLLAQGPVEIVARTDVLTGWRPTPVVVAQVQAIESSPEAGDYVLVHGHLDGWHFGATDNATGDAVLMELARFFHASRGRLRRGVKLAWWPGHSAGRYSGSTWYVDQHWIDLDKHCVATYNIDQPGLTGRSVQGLQSTEELGGFVGDALLLTEGVSTEVEGPGRNSDQSFWGVGIASVLAGRHDPERAEKGLPGVAWWWHTPDDLLDKVDYDVLKQDVVTYGSMIGHIAGSSLLPFRFESVARRLVAVTADYQETAGGTLDLGGILEKSRRLQDTLRELDDGLTAVGETGDASAALNRATNRLVRTLLPVLYTEGDRFRQDLAVEVERLPGLQRVGELARLSPDSDTFRFLQTELVRNRNRVEVAIDSAESQAQELLAHLSY